MLPSLERVALFVPGKLVVCRDESIILLVSSERSLSVTYAARFCAFLLDCAGVKLSFSSLLLLLPCGISSMSSAIPLSIEPFGSMDSCCAGGDAEVAGSGVRPVPVPSDASKDV